MDDYKPKLWHAVSNALLGMVFTGLYAYPSRWENAWLIGAVVFYLMTAAVFMMLFAEQRRAFYHSMGYFAEQLSKLNPEQWQALGIRFPHLRIRWKGKPIQFFEDTGATMDDFERFMKNSGTNQISPERNWSGGPQRRAWNEIKDWLEEQNYIYAQSAAGNHSWLWRGSAYTLLWDRYIQGYENVIEDLNLVDGPLTQEMTA